MSDPTTGPGSQPPGGELGEAGLASPPPSEQGRRPGNLARDARLVVAGVGVALLVWFAAANVQEVRITFWLTSTTAPLVVVVVIAGALGAGVAAVATKLARRRRRADRSR